MFIILLLILLASGIGCIIGTITGLTPGLHVNTVALLLVSSSATIFGILSTHIGIETHTAALIVAIIIVSTSLTHTFVDFVPSTFLGVPDDETALSVLPAHRLLLQGDGFKAVYLSVVGSITAVILACVFLLPYSWVLGSPLDLYVVIKDRILFILLFLSSLLLATENAKILGHRCLGTATALTLFLLAGVLGSIVLSLPTVSPFGLYSTPLFPLFSGLFGISTLLISLNDTSENGIPPQRITRLQDIGDYGKNAIPGGLAGSIVGFLPGVSSAHAALIALIPGGKNRERSPESVIVTMGAVNTSNAIFVLVALFLTGRARSGAAVAIMEFVPVDPWVGPLPYFLCLFIISIIFTSFLAYHITLWMGRVAAENITTLPYEKLIWSVILFILILVIIFNGILGLVILATVSCFGMLPPLLGVRRSHLMGVLLVPVMLYYW